jgi:uroporphyrinogen-III synthase
VEALFLAGSARARAVLESGAARVCAIGDATAFALEQHGVEVAIRANGTGASALAEAVIADARRRGLAGARVLFPCAEASRPELVNVLVAAGLTVVAVPVYTTHELDAVAAPPLSHPADSVVFFSPSAVRAFARTRPFDARQWIAVGETTRLALVEAGFPSPRAASSPAARHVIEALA